MNSKDSELIKTVFKAVVVIAIFWVSGFILVQFGQRVFGGWAVSEAGEVLACVFGVLLAFRLRVKLVAYVLAGQLAFSFSELALHSIYGNRSVQGGPTHFAVMLAGTVGVVLGWFLRSRSDTAGGGTSSERVTGEVTAGGLASGAA